MAKKKDSKVSIASVDKVLKAVKMEAVARTVELGDESLEMCVKPLLSFDAFTRLVNESVNALFFEDEDLGVEVYHPEFECVAKAMALMIFVADFKPEMDTRRVFDLMYKTDVLEKIYSVWNKAQRADFEQAFERGVKDRRELIAAGERAKLIRLGIQMDSAALIMEKISAVFAGLDGDEVQNAISAMANMTEDNLAKALVRERGDDFVKARRSALEVVK